MVAKAVLKESVPLHKTNKCGVVINREIQQLWSNTEWKRINPRVVVTYSVNILMATSSMSCNYYLKQVCMHSKNMHMNKYMCNSLFESATTYNICYNVTYIVWFKLTSSSYSCMTLEPSSSCALMGK